MMNPRRDGQVQAYFDTYGDALAVCTNGGYQGADLVAVVVEKNRLIRDQLAQNPTLDLNAGRSFMGFAFCHSNHLKVLDFGGGGGYHYTIARLAFPRQSRLSWAVVETPALAEAAKCLETDELSFFDSIERASAYLDGVDVVFTSGALQCCDDPLGYLANLLMLRAKRIFITRTSFNHEAERLITVQTSKLSQNGPGTLPSGFNDREVLYPNVFVPLSSVQEIIRAHGYQIRYLMVEEPGYQGRNGPLFLFGIFAELD